MIKLTDKDKEYLKSIRYEKTDFAQIEEAMNKSTFGVFEEGNIDKCKVVDYEMARELLGSKTLLSGLSRSAFHCSTSRIIPHTFGKYILSIDSGILFTNNKSRLLKKHDESFDLDSVENLKDRPCVRVFNIKWDTSDSEYEGEEDVDLSSEIIIPLEKIPEHANDLDMVAEYISYETGFCHYGEFEIECNYEVDELYEMMEKLDKELDGEYEDGETTWASNLECMKEELEALICLMEEYDNELTLDN